MRFILDTHLLIWLAQQPDQLSTAAITLLEDAENDFVFSAVSIWEIAIKHALKKPDFDVEPSLMRRACLENDMHELAITSDHAIVVATLPLIHGDPFDRLLVAQSIAEGIELLTNDRTVARYSAPVRLV